MQDPLPKRIFPFIGYFLKGHRWNISMFIFFSIAIGFAAPYNSIIIKQIINLLQNREQVSILSIVGIASLIVLNFFLFQTLTWVGLTYIRSRFIASMIHHIIAALMDYLLGKSHRFYQENLSGKIVKHITNVVDGIEAMTTHISWNILRGTASLLASFVIVYLVHPIFCCILVAWFICFAGSSMVLLKKLGSLTHAHAATESMVVGDLVDVLSNQSTVRLFSNRRYEHARMISMLHKKQHDYKAIYCHTLIMYAIQGSLITLMAAALVYFLTLFHQKNLVTIGDFALILGLSIDTGYAIWCTLLDVNECNKIAKKCNQSLTILMTPLNTQEQPNAVALRCEHGAIRFNGIRFAYDTTKYLFQNQSIHIQSGQKVGLVGYSGGGKSTFVHLILRLYDVEQGSILIDNQDIRDVTLDSLHQKIAMIPQHPSLFHRSLMENIRYGNIYATDQEVIEASKKAHAHEFIMQLPHRYASIIGEPGVKLSGGQCQRIAIARAILKNAPILMLDEATSQLDSVTENLIQESLHTLMNDHKRTILIIAHRLSTLLHTNRILVFDRGKIIEDGAHSYLLAKNGLYKKLWDTQVDGFLGNG